MPVTGAQDDCLQHVCMHCCSLAACPLHCNIISLATFIIITNVPLRLQQCSYIKSLRPEEFGIPVPLQALLRVRKIQNACFSCCKKAKSTW